LLIKGQTIKCCLLRAWGMSRCNGSISSSSSCHLPLGQCLSK